jgi:hypothetical protein
VTFTGVSWVTGTPQWSPVSAVDIVTLFTPDGSTWYGFAPASNNARPKSTWWYGNPHTFANGSVNYAALFQQFNLWTPPVPITFTAVGLFQASAATTGTCNLYLGIYDCDANGLPGTLLAQSATPLDGTAGGANVFRSSALSANVTVPAGKPIAFSQGWSGTATVPPAFYKINFVTGHTFNSVVPLQTPTYGTYSMGFFAPFAGPSLPATVSGLAADTTGVPCFLGQSV